MFVVTVIKPVSHATLICLDHTSLELIDLAGYALRRRAILRINPASEEE